MKNFHQRVKKDWLLQQSVLITEMFTGGCTLSLNIAIQGFPHAAGSNVLTCETAHHALARPLRKVADDRGLHFIMLQCPRCVCARDDTTGRTLRAPAELVSAARPTAGAAQRSRR